MCKKNINVDSNVFIGTFQCTKCGYKLSNIAKHVPQCPVCLNDALDLFVGIDDTKISPLAILVFHHR